MRILVTGFEPFGGEQVNASGEAVTLLASHYRHPAVELCTQILPVSFRRGPDELRSAISRHLPHAVVAVGEAGGRAEVTPELFAVNDQVARIADNDGAMPVGPIDDGPGSMKSRLPVDELVEAVRRAGVPCVPSQDAGRYVCNAVFRTALTCWSGPAGFVHVPAVRRFGVAGVGGETDPDGPSVVHGLSVVDLSTALAVIVDELADFLSRTA